MKKIVITALVLLMSAGAYAAGDKSKTITAKSYGDKWPFTFEKGELICSTGIVVLKNSKDGKVYALNGMANALADSGRKLGKATILNNKAVTKPDPKVAGYQMSTVDIMMEGRELCN
ncbi:DUF2511 domain-containing protein [Candidatus Symbiopectobacterium sp. NZEC127]|uniref:YebY family protein n=1 Tax=Candidatus Symbiopectobacterium sp. NZEC127 TaxID=2820472 RepID=UPI00222656FB|nr:YebY family protein [Candidatus Symbiopectobacterium sp. NZEC127]MCW2487079.1 DUF2511 domain-containing protein [Candidatus Symbiopectobacterium sp. NZEC127]